MDPVVMPLRTDEDVVRLRQAVRSCLVSAGFSLVDQTKMVTAASELARNTVIYGGGGESRLIRLANGPRKGVALEFIDHGPGIADIGKALSDGYTTGTGMGLGLGGAKRLADEFEIESELGKGTTVKITKWKPF
ncbi:MAG: anti-sigma regulatory factor [Noviherbaspirillum sp.]